MNYKEWYKSQDEHFAPDEHILAKKVWLHSRRTFNGEILQKENEELRGVLREAIRHCDNILSCCLSDTTQENYAHDFLDRPEVKALLEKDKE